MISPQFRPIVGGYERSAERLSLALAIRGHNITVLAERRYPEWPKYEMMEKVVIHRWWCIYRRRLHILTSIIGILIWLMVNGRTFQIWHVHQYGVFGTVAVLLGRLMRRPVVMKLMNSGPHGLDVMLSRLRFRRIHIWAHRRVAACIAISEETEREALEFGFPKSRIRRISNGISTQEFRPPTADERTKARKSKYLQNEFLAVAVGRLEPMKNPLGLLEAWDSVCRSISKSVMLVWVGNGSQRQEMESAIVELGLVDRIILAGHSNDVYSWFAAADVYLLPSYTEGMSNSLLEAMACGLPSIATAVSGTSELLVKSGSGIVVPVGDMQAFAEGIVTLALDIDKRLAMGKRARTKIAAYSLDVTSRQVEELYKKLLHES